MKISNKLLNIIITSIYIITLFLGNSNFLGFINVGEIINYIIVFIPSLLILLILIENRKRLKRILSNKISISLAIIFILWILTTFIVGINIGIQGIKAIIHFGIIIILLIIFSQIEFEENQLSRIKKHFFIAFAITLIYGLVEYIFKLNLDIYSNGKYPGMNGRIYSTFYIATLYDKYIAMVSAFVCYEIQKIKNTKSKEKYLLWILLLLSGICVSLTFSRTGLLLYLANLFLLCITLVYRKKIKEIIYIFVIIGSMFLLPGVKYSFNSAINVAISMININTNTNNDTKEEISLSDDKAINENFDPSQEYRAYYKSVGKEIMKEYPIVGIGIGNYSYIYNNQNVKEFLKNNDFISIKYMYPHSSYVQLGAETGIFGVILFYVFIISTLIESLFSKYKIKKIFLLYIIIQFLAISYVEGIIYAKQYIYLFAIIYALYLNSTNTKKIKKDKITFLLLHLGYGGIETSTINTANALCDKYKIELVSFYNLNKNQLTKIDKNIDIKYLYNGSPNKEKFLLAIKNKKLFKIIKEGIKSVSILLKKKILIIKEIKNTDSKYIISTRYDFSRLLSKYGNYDNIKIAQEHHYHNNDKKYINILKKKYNNIDYLFALTKTLEKDYKKFLKNNKHTKVVLVPNMLSEMPNESSKLNKNNIITVSRLDYGKRNDEIIEVFSQVYDKSSKLFIIGDGIEYNNLNNLVKKLNLEDRVILTGYKDKIEIEKYMLKSSLFLMASETEGLPMVLLEAMSYGIPCIAYETASGVSDIIDDGKNGFIIKNRNREQYINKIDYILKNSNKRIEIGKNAKQKVDNFSKDKILNIWYNILNDSRRKGKNG